MSNTENIYIEHKTIEVFIIINSLLKSSSAHDVS